MSESHRVLSQGAIPHAAANAGWFDHVRVVNQRTNAVLVDQQVRYDGNALQPAATVRVNRRALPNAGAGEPPSSDRPCS